MLAHDVTAPIDVPPFDRANVDGFALRSADTAGASDIAPRRFPLNGEVIVCGHAPALEVSPGSATTIATGGMVPRGADAVVMIEHTELLDGDGAPAIDLRRTVAPGQFISYAGSDIARGEVVLRRKTPLSSREIGMLAACGVATVEVVRKPKVAVLSTGDELVAPGGTLGPARVYDSNGAIIAAAVTEAGGEPVPFGAFPDDEVALELAMRTALDVCDIVVLSGGTSKGAGDLSHRIVAKLGEILVHGVALKPGKPLCLAVIDGKPLGRAAGLSHLRDLHLPCLRCAGDPGACRSCRRRQRGPSRPTCRCVLPPSLAERSSSWSRWSRERRGRSRFRPRRAPVRSRSFSQADGFLEIDALASALDAGTRARVTLIGQTAALPDLVVVGSHCIALDVVLGALAERGLSARTIAVGSMGGVAAAERGECDLAPAHLVDPASGVYNAHLLREGLALVKGWQRMQGFVHRPDDARFAGRDAAGALEAALADRECLMVNRNAGSGTRVLIDRLLAGARPPATAISRARTTPSRLRWRRAARIGGSRSNRLPGCTVSGFSRSRPRTMIFSWSKAAAIVPRSRHSLRRCAIRACARASARSACAPRTPELLPSLAMMLRVLVIFMLLAVMSARGGAGAIARPWRAGARARDFS